MAPVKKSVVTKTYRISTDAAKSLRKQVANRSPRVSENAYIEFLILQADEQGKPAKPSK